MKSAAKTNNHALYHGIADLDLIAKGFKVQGSRILLQKVHLESCSEY